MATHRRTGHKSQLPSSGSSSNRQPTSVCSGNDELAAQMLSFQGLLQRDPGMSSPGIAKRLNAPA